MFGNFYQWKKAEVLKKLSTQDGGLTTAEAKKRLGEFGVNQLKEKKQHLIWKLIFEQFSSFLIIILILAGALSIFLGEKVDAIAIFAIILLNAILGFIQEYKAERSLDELKKIETINSRVLRDGEEITINAKNLVPGDIILLFEGEKIPADCRLLEVHNFEVDESLLTGESLPVFKEETVYKEDLSLADRKNMIYSSCMVLRGRAKAVVVKTGMKTEIGQLAHQIQETKEELTPLQIALDVLGKRLALIALIMVLPIIGLSLIKGQDFFEAIMLAVSLAVSSIPEGLPVVVTITLALGVKRMVKINVLTKKLPAVESLGGVDVICSDKTGTITKNQMSVVSLFLPKYGFFNFPNDLSKIQVNQDLNHQFNFKNASKREKELLLLMEEAVLCSDAREDFGDPTEIALLKLLKAYEPEAKILKTNQRVNEIPFSSENKYMAVAVLEGKSLRGIIKGAPEVVFELCKLTKKQKTECLEINNNFAKRGLRVLAVASKKITAKPENSLEKLSDYQFLGLVALQDPPREKVAEALDKCQKAGVRVLMITGDHKNTATAIAQKIGLKTQQSIEGKQIDKMTKEELQQAVQECHIFARVSPNNKVQILEALQSLGLQVAMTGDGVNDAPALKKAEIGMAVGSGTDLSKGVADMIILDDDFSTIVTGIEEGRHIFFNIKKFVRFLLSANFDEILCVAASIVFGLPLCFLPIHILWLNLVTDSLPALALSNDVETEDLMSKPPYNPQKEILNGVISYAALAGVLGYIVTFLTFVLALYVWQMPEDYARTMSFSAMVFFELFLVFSVRSDESVFKIGVFSNLWLNLAVLVVSVLQILAIYNPFLQRFLSTESLELRHLFFILTFASLGFWGMELVKYFKKKS